MNPDRITTRTGITIGCAYRAPAPQPARDAEHIQAALLAKRTARFERVLDWIDRWAIHAYILMALGGVALGLAIRWAR